MHILLTDETNVRPDGNVLFFIYGGLFFPIEHLSVLHDRINEVRVAAGYRPGDEFKFDTRARPDHVTPEAATDAKRQVVELCAEMGCRFIAHVIHHNIIRDQDAAQHVKWAADYVIGRFNLFLREANDDGICVIDNLPHRGEFRYLADKFSRGLTIPGGRHLELDRIKLFASTCVGASHASSALDIVLGSFRYCVNTPRNPEAAQAMFPRVVRLMWHRDHGGVRLVRGRGLILRPALRDIISIQYRRDYDELLDRFRDMVQVRGQETEAG